jgi:hypothetical protein
MISEEDGLPETPIIPEEVGLPETPNDVIVREDVE